MLILAYYETLGPVGHKCRYHAQAPYVQRCHLNPSDFPEPAVLVLDTDGTARFEIVCHAVEPSGTDIHRTHTYTWQLEAAGDASSVWPPGGQMVCSDQHEPVLAS